MARLICERLPILEDEYKQEIKRSEGLRKRFVADFPITRIKSLSLEQYVIGKRESIPSFCYRLEQELDRLGRIRGSNAFKFGVYFGKFSTDPKLQYRFRKHWAVDVDKAFDAVKSAIIHLLQAGSKDDMTGLRKNKISPMFKGKILFIYFPEKFAPVYSKLHLEHFLSQLNISGDLATEVDMQRALMEYRAGWPMLSGCHPCLYMRFLYDLFGRPSAKTSATAASISLPLLDKAIEGAIFVHAMPPVATPNLEVVGGKSDPQNYESQRKRNKIIGDRGERIVLALEKRRLSESNRKDLAKKVSHVSQKDNGAGYDILSFDDDGTERPIEVKATSAENLERGFYVTANEVDKATSLTNYYLYFVFSATSNHPKVHPAKNLFGDSGALDLRPVVFHSTIGKRKSEF